MVVDASGQLTIWTVYDHPLDHPDVFVAREWLIPEGGGDPIRTQRTLTSHNLDEIRQALEDMGGYPLARDPADDPVIIESWV